MAKITDEILGHAEENDGIEEYDNPLPDWWIGLFIVTIVWGIAYAANYHFLEQTSQIERYEEEMALAALQWPESEAPEELSFDASTLDEGAEIYVTQCQSCHNEGGKGGGIGPSLVDAEWIHGSSPEEIRATITNGVLEKGMPAWGQILGPARVAKVAAYIVKLPRAEPVDAPVEEPAVEEPAVEGEDEADDAVAPEGEPEGADEASAVDFGAMSEDDQHAYLMELGEKVYLTGDGGLACTTCHQANGQGIANAFPPLVGQRDHMGDCETHAGIVLNGMSGELVVDGITYNGVMTPQKDMLSDLQIAAVVTYERNSWGNDYGDCSPSDVSAARAK